MEKRFRETGKGKDDFFFLPAYLHTVKQEQYSFKGMCDVDACEQSHVIALSWGANRYTVTQEKYSFKGNVRPSVLALSAYLSA